MLFPNDSHVVILYQAEVKAKDDKLVFSRVLGTIIFLVSFFSLSLFLGPTVVSELTFRFQQLKKDFVRIVKNQPPKPNKIQLADLLGEVEFEQIPAPVDENFGIVIPKIGVNVKVIPNVDAGKPGIFTKSLKEGVAHAAGTSLPDQEGTIFIFGHSADYAWDIARYNAVFYQIKDLEIGDEINLFYNTQKYFYKVTEKRTVSAKDTGFLHESISGKRLVLQTCWPPGTIKERLLVFAKPVPIVVTSDITNPIMLTN